MKWLMDLRWTLSKSLWKVGRRTFLSFVLLGCFITCFILLKLYKILPVGYRRYYIRAFADRPVYDTCVERHVVLSKLPLPLTALASFPGSGNSWARHLIQQLTGIATTSKYCDTDLRDNGFPFECLQDKRFAIVTKTHDVDISNYDQAIVLIRNPYEALMSYFHLPVTGHTGEASVKMLRRIANKEFQNAVINYVNIYHAWLKQFKKPIVLLQYSAMKHNLTSQLLALAKFLNVDVDNFEVNCTVTLQEGQYHRTTSKDRIFIMKEIYDADMRKEMGSVVHTVEEIIRERLNIKVNLADGVEKYLNS